MVFRINHIHIKARQPRVAADWFVGALNFSILSDETRETGERFIRCLTEDKGLAVVFSGERDGETLPDGLTGLHLGLEHFGFDSIDIEADAARMAALGATIDDGPRAGRGGLKVAFLQTPGGVRIELMQFPKQ